jgi:cytochrome c oxidase subunit 2
MPGSLQTLAAGCVRARASTVVPPANMRFPASLRSLLRCASCALAVVALTRPAAAAFWLEGPQSTIQTAGPVAETQYHVMVVTLRVVLTIFVIVGSLLTYVTLKFKARSSADEHAAPPPQSHGNPLVEIALIVASILTLVFIAVPTLKGIWYAYDVPEAERANAYKITATGKQWWFKFEYTGEQGLVTANELVIPAGRAVRIELRSDDVIHSFWVPKLAGKVDMIPNRANHIWLESPEPGYFWGQCAEFCGEDHAVMRFRVIALNESDFKAWLANQKQPARTVTVPAGAVAQKPGYDFKNPGRNAPGWSKEFDADPLGNWQKQQKIPAAEDAALIAEGSRLFVSKTCSSCHAIRGLRNAVGVVAPDLTHIGSRSTIAGGVLENTPQNLHRWITDPNNVKPGNKMFMGVGPMPGFMKRNETTGEMTEHNISVSDPEAYALVAYLQSLK